VDARYEKARAGGRVVSQEVLVVSGVRDDGMREILGVEVADTESETTYQEMFRSLKARGLKGVELVVSDGHEGLKAAVSRHFQGGVVAALPGPLREEPPRHGGDQQAQGARRRPARHLRRGERGEGARARLLGGRKVAREGRRGGGRAPRGARRRVPLSCLSFPESHRKRIRTINGLERLNQEIKRRTRVVRIFPNREACLRLVTALCVEQSEEWVTGRRYLDMEELDEQRCEEREEAEEEEEEEVIMGR